MPVKLAMYGHNGHQLQHSLAAYPQAQLVAVAGIPADRLTEAQRADTTITHYPTLAALLADPRVDLVSLCSPRRADQAADAIACLQAGKHVYAEKPCALTEAELDAILAAAARAGRVFHEMAGTVFAQPWWAARAVVQSGVLGQIVQVFAQKSYPYYDGRPQDEAVDGGLTLQNGVHAFRFVEHITGLSISAVQAWETTLGNPVAGGGLRMATSCTLRLANGGVGSLVINYLNPRGFGSWGNEQVRIFGTQGMLECVDAGTKTRLVLGEKDHGPLDTTAAAPDFLVAVLAEIAAGKPFPLTLAEELHPLRVAIRARAMV